MASSSSHFDSSQVSPGDAVAAVRSFPRRFGEAFDSADVPADVAARPSEGAASPVERAAWTASALATIDSALHQVLVTDDPAVEPPPVDPPPAGSASSAAAALDRLRLAARSLADAIAEVHGDDWSRSGRTATGKVSALDLARLAVQIGVDNLRAVESSLRGPA